MNKMDEEESKKALRKQIRKLKKSQVKITAKAGEILKLNSALKQKDAEIKQLGKFIIPLEDGFKEIPATEEGIAEFTKLANKSKNELLEVISKLANQHWKQLKQKDEIIQAKDRAYSKEIKILEKEIDTLQIKFQSADYKARQKDAEIKELKDLLDICTTSHTELSEKIVLLNKENEAIKQKTLEELKGEIDKYIKYIPELPYPISLKEVKSKLRIDIHKLITKKQEEI